MRSSSSSSSYEILTLITAVTASILEGDFKRNLDVNKLTRPHFVFFAQ